VISIEDAILVLRRLTWMLEKRCIWYRVCGGFAVDGYVGRLTRDHHDVDIVMKRSDIHKLSELPIFVVELKSRSVLRAKIQPWDVIIEILLLENDSECYWIKGRKEYSAVPSHMMEGSIVKLEDIAFRVPSKELILATKQCADRPIDVQDRATLVAAGVDAEAAAAIQFCYVVRN
jgi:hypothetical protein